MRHVAASGEQHELEHGRQRAVVTEVGATLRSWSLDGTELLDSFGLDTPGGAYRGKVLMPWPNRLRDGAYEFAGRRHALALTEPERGNALHGLVTWVNWRESERTSSRIRLSHRLHAQPGYPFVLDLDVTYALTGDGVEVTLEATNPGDRPVPFGAGLHPYLAVAGGPVDQAQLRVPAGARLPVDEQAIPTGGSTPVAGTAFDFRAMRRIGDATVDHCFTDLERDADGRARVLVAFDGQDGGRRELSVWMDEAFSHVQVYTADEDPDPERRRRSIAVEPMTCAPDAFNSGAGLLVLEPGQRFSGRCGLSVAGS